MCANMLNVKCKINQILLICWIQQEEEEGNKNILSSQVLAFELCIKIQHYGRAVAWFV